MRLHLPKPPLLPSQINLSINVLAKPRTCCSAASFESNVSDRKSTRLNSSHLGISYAVFCLKKKKKSELRKRRERHSANDSNPVAERGARSSNHPRRTPPNADREHNSSVVHSLRWNQRNRNS